MRVIIAGSRTITDPATVAHAIAASTFTITEVVSGCARGVDRLGEEWALSHERQHNGVISPIPVRRFPAEWDKHGRAAGYIRNMEMCKYAQALVCIWDGQSPGSAHMIRIARERGLLVHVEQVVGYQSRFGGV